MGLAAICRTTVLAAALLLVPFGGSGVLAQEQADVEANDELKFAPERITVPVGGTVVWTNVGAAPHTVTGGEIDAADPNSPIGDGRLDNQGSTYRVTFEEEGTFPYFCRPHAATRMVGEVVVTGADTPDSPAPTGSVRATATPEPVRPGASASPIEGETGDDPHGVPGLEDNPKLAEIEAKRASQERALGGFRAFAAAATAALLALGIAMFASTRTRRGGR